MNIFFSRWVGLFVYMKVIVYVYTKIPKKVGLKGKGENSTHMAIIS